MKNLFVALVTLTAFTSLHAQTAHRDVPVANNSLNTEIGTSGGYTGKAVRNFKRYYKHIYNETWFAIPNGHRARFVESGIRHDVTFDKRGNWLYTIRQYKENLCPKDIRSQIRSIYSNYSVILVEEIERPMKPLVYVVHMEDQRTFKNIQLCDKEMETVLEIRKI